MTINNLSGVIVPVGTPLTGDDRVDVEGLRALQPTSSTQACIRCLPMDP